MHTTVKFVINEKLLRSFLSLPKFCVGLDTLVKEKMFQSTDEKGVKCWMCTECGYSSPKTSNIYKHVERVHLNVSLFCDYCNRQFKSRNDLNVHKKICVQIHQ